MSLAGWVEMRGVVVDVEPAVVEVAGQRGPLVEGVADGLALIFAHKSGQAPGRMPENLGGTKNPAKNAPVGAWPAGFFVVYNDA